MKKIFTLIVMALTFCGVASAEGSEGYNRVGVSYNNTNHMFNKGWEDMDNFKTNGFGIDYIHGFSVSKSLPMFVEVGGNVNFGFGNMLDVSYMGYSEKLKFQDINLQVPVNFAYRFRISNEFSIAPYIGLNFKLHLMTRGKLVVEDEGDKEESDWESFFDKEATDDATWNRFQMGWHIGANFQYERFSFVVQYGTDFIPAYSYKEDGFNSKINTGNLKIVLGYNF